MTKDVLVSVSGLQFEIDQDEPIEVITGGEYYSKNGKHYIIYDEIIEGYEGITKNTIKVAENQINIMKKGVSNVHMIFEEKKKNMTYYNTPFGDLLIGINTTFINVEEKENELFIKIDYALEVNYSHISDCAITIKVTSKKRKDSSFIKEQENNYIKSVTNIGRIE